MPNQADSASGPLGSQTSTLSWRATPTRRSPHPTRRAGDAASDQIQRVPSSNTAKTWSPRSRAACAKL